MVSFDISYQVTGLFIQLRKDVPNNVVLLLIHNKLFGSWGGREWIECLPELKFLLDFVERRSIQFAAQPEETNKYVLLESEENAGKLTFFVFVVFLC